VYLYKLCICDTTGYDDAAARENSKSQDAAQIWDNDEPRDRREGEWRSLYDWVENNKTAARYNLL